ncbi:NSFL1 cofactor p47 [Eurytemora carolleeae]|uniref:NSFL1 cofactor p47 n=1 Tax=Eurytemora carolleeae TaxID=1294199 RepID=UPI000C77A527|nr:NSFL1 cofactor p47 [Eurytemora carolleeae]|eukprot:XP_023324190.1 NSFL1 cofactor p47-like [Eurytemora affinis]
MADDGVIAEFQNITGCDVERAKFYLESANMQLDLAISSFYEGDGMEGVEPSEPVPEDIPPQDSVAGGRPVGILETVPRINRLPLDQGSDSEEEEEEEGQAFYAGGSSSSGNVILGPGKKKDVVGRLFRKAKESGAEEVRPGEGGARGSLAFSGGGYSLGSENQPSVAIGGASAAPSEEPRTFVLKMWQVRFGLSLD